MKLKLIQIIARHFCISAKTNHLPLHPSLIPVSLSFFLFPWRDRFLPHQDKACEAMELFDMLIECDVAMVVPHLIPLIQFCLEIAMNQQVGNNIRVKALSFVSWLTTLKKKVR